MAPRANQAAWEKSAEDLAADPGRLAALDVVSVERMSERTGMSVGSIADSLFRQTVIDPTNAKAHLCRPAYRIASVPYWSQDQAKAAEGAARTARERTGRGPALPMTEVGQDEALSVRDMAKVTGRHEQTARRWISGQYAVETAGKFPRPIGRRKPSRRHGNPETVYPRQATLAWLVRAEMLDAEVSDAEIDARISAADDPVDEPAAS